MLIYFFTKLIYKNQMSAQSQALDLVKALSNLNHHAKKAHSKKNKCQTCKINSGILICSECKDTSQKYCSEKCASKNWKMHACLIGNGVKRDREEQEQEPMKRTPDLAENYIIALQVVGQTRAFLETLLENMTAQDLFNYMSVSKTFTKYIMKNGMFWYLFLKKHTPFRLLLIHAKQKKSNKVTIDNFDPSIDYSVFGKQLFLNESKGNDIRNQHFYFQTKLNVENWIQKPTDVKFEVYVEDIDGYGGTEVYPKQPTFKGIIQAYKNTLNNYRWLSEPGNFEKIDAFIVVWEWYAVDDHRGKLEADVDDDDFQLKVLELDEIPWNAERIIARCSFSEKEESSESENESSDDEE